MKKKFPSYDKLPKLFSHSSGLEQIAHKRCRTQGQEVVFFPVRS